MELKNQVTSVELSNKIHELGITTPSLFYRDSTKSSEDEIEMWDEKGGDYCPDNVNCYTVAELGEMLPYHMCDEHEDLPYYLTCEKREDPNYWIVFYNESDRGILAGTQFEETTEADARAKMLIYLLENNLLTNK